MRLRWNVVIISGVWFFVRFVHAVDKAIDSLAVVSLKIVDWLIIEPCMPWQDYLISLGWYLSEDLKKQW